MHHDVMARLPKAPCRRIVGGSAGKVAPASRLTENLHADVPATLPANRFIAVRAGHRCAMPLVELFGLAATTRASSPFYNAGDDIEPLADAVRYARGLPA
jgi:cysteine desulfurase/selenocysteine lyase